MNISLNGEARQIDAKTLADALIVLGFDDKGEPVFGSRRYAHIYYNHDGPAAGKILLAGSKEALHFISSVKREGLYSVIFTVARERRELELAEELVPEAFSYSWTGSALVNVE